MAEIQQQQRQQAALRRRLIDALRHIPDAESLAYREAMATAPSVVERESDPILFLTFARGDFIAAARRICCYWHVRKLNFGQRAFLPLNITGIGALSAKDIRSLRNGYAAVLPCHSSGRSVFVLNKSKCCEGLSSQHLESRALFYQLQQVCENHLSHTDGIYVLIQLQRELIETVDTNLGADLFSRLVDAFPITIHALHLVAVIPIVSQLDASLLQVLQSKLSSIKQSWEKALRVFGNAQLHVATSETTAGQILEREAFSRASLPISMGGSWTYEIDFEQYLLIQLSKERLLAAGSCVLAPSNCRLVAATATSTGGAAPQLMQSGTDGSGGNGLGVNNPGVHQLGLSRLDEAIQCLPDEKKQAYVEALEKCPALVQMESTPINFLRFEGFDPWAAARRLTTYWTWRKRIFRERAFLPMTMTGEGALSYDDVVHVRRGYFTILPNDRDGRTVICYNPSRRAGHSKETRMKVGFYYWSVICENEISRRDGYVGVVLLGTSGFGQSSIDGAVKECADMAIESFPTRAKNIHLVQCVVTGGRRSLLQMILPLLNYVMGRVMENRAVNHVADTSEAILRGLMKFGLDPKGVPFPAGGSWTYDNIYRWQFERCTLERNRYGARREEGPGGRVNGMVADPVTSNAFVRVQRVSIMESLHRLPVQEKACGVEALTNHASLVESESCPEHFLGSYEGDVVTAAHQFSFYWTYRCALFGGKTYLPMTQTGEGALGRSDLTALSSGCFSILPSKKQEQVIIVYDISKQAKLDTPSIQRIAFYAFQVASENPISRSKGVVVIVTGLLHVVKEQTRVEFQQILHAMPLKVSSLHCVHIYSMDDDKMDIALDNALSVVRQKFGTVGDQKALLHVGHSKDDLYENLRPYGIRREILPKGLGGSFGYDRFVQWQETRTRFEWGLPAGANDHETVYDFSSVKPLSQLIADEKKERKRRMNVVHSRRKRERERIEIQVLREQCSDLNDDKNVLLRDNERLEGLLRSAKTMISDTSTSVGENSTLLNRKPSGLPSSSANSFTPIPNNGEVLI